jgi:hypothetical protein
MSDKEKEMESAVSENEKAENEEESMVIVFKKPYVFERVEYKEIDLSCMEDLQASDMIAVNKLMKRTSAGIDVMPEMSLEYACNIAAKATQKPIEFFLQLPPREAMRVKNKVLGFLFGSE